MKLHTTRRPRYRTRDNLPCLSAWVDWPLECGECVGLRGLLARWTLAGPLLLMREYCGVEHAEYCPRPKRIKTEPRVRTYPPLPLNFTFEEPPENQMDGSFPTGLMHSSLPHPSRGSQTVVSGFSLVLKRRAGPLNHRYIVPFPVLVMDVVRGLGSV
jgi:hypothetical protein